MILMIYTHGLWFVIPPPNEVGGGYTGLLCCVVVWHWLILPLTKTERSLGWLTRLSLEMLKLVFIVSSDDQGSHPDDLSVSVLMVTSQAYSVSKMPQASETTLKNMGKETTWIHQELYRWYSTRLR